MRAETPDDRPGYWRRVGRLARQYLGCVKSTIVRDADLTAEPYRRAHLTLAPVWDQDAELVVPLVVHNTELRGFWRISFRDRADVTPAHHAMIRTLAHEIAVALDRRNAAPQPEEPSGLRGWIFGARRFALEVDEVKRSFDSHTQHQQDLLKLGESMRFGVFVSTLWGDVRYANSAMRDVCAGEKIDLAVALGDLGELVAKLTGLRASEIHERMRELVQAGRELQLTGETYDVILTWLNGSGGQGDGEQLVVGCVLPRTRSAKSTGSLESRASRDSTSLLSALAATAARKAPDDCDVTVPRPKTVALAQGTPSFRKESVVQRIDPALLISFGEPDRDDDDEVTVVT
jgi:hypothetical protein